jgi:hypothetical protein
MPEQSFFANLFQDSQIQDPLTRKLKNSLARALLNFQMATEVEFASKVSPQLFNNIDIYNFDRKDMLSFNAFRDEIEVQKDSQGLLAVAQKLLDLNDPVLRFCVAVELSEVILTIPSPITLENKSLTQLRQMATQDGGQVVQAVKDQVNRELAAGTKLSQ